MTIHTYAVLKDYFGKSFTVDDPPADIAALRALLVRKNLAAEAILNNCRFAAGDNFVDDQYQIQTHDNIHIIPPSSGG